MHSKSKTVDFRFMAILGFILAAAGLRVALHIPNFTPIAAMALFGGAMFEKKSIGIMATLIALFLSDLAIGFHDLMPAVYGSFVVIALIGIYVGQRSSWSRIFSASLVSSTVFFVITNFAVWAQGLMYPKTFSGAVECYVAALPFFRNTLAGDLVYTLAIFGLWKAAEKSIPQLRALPVKA